MFIAKYPILETSGHKKILHIKVILLKDSNQCVA